jgi:hypothetical protein
VRSHPGAHRGGDDQRQRNRYLGGVKPFGFDVKDGELVPDPRV